MLYNYTPFHTLIKLLKTNIGQKLPRQCYEKVIVAYASYLHGVVIVSVIVSVIIALRIISFAELSDIEF